MICNECAQRKCKTEATYNKWTGRFACKQFKEPRGGFSFLEMVIEGSPESTLELLFRHNLKVVETKKGLKVRYGKRT